MKPERIIWHHTALKDTEPQFERVNKYHQERGFPRGSLGWYVGYHYLIEEDGRVRQARVETEIGAHDANENINSIGICLAGNFSIALPSLDQTIAAAKLVKDIRTRWPIPITRIEPHRWDDNTECPGLKLPDNWLVVEYLKGAEDADLRKFYEIAERYGLI